MTIFSLTRPVPVVQIDDVMPCESSVNMYDLVYTDTDQLLLKAAVNNLSDEPVIGLVIGKPESEKAKVLLLGYLRLQSDFPIGKLFVDTDGTFKIGLPPETGYQQHLGYSFGSKIFFQPMTKRNKKT